MQLLSGMLDSIAVQPWWLLPLALLALDGVGNRKAEGVAPAAVGIDPDGAAEPIDRAFADRQPHPRARVFGGPSEALGYLERLVGVGGPKSGTVVGHRKVPRPRRPLGRYVDAGADARVPHVERVGHQLLE